MAIFYPWIKALHLMALISWMAALFYLPRLFVYHAERGKTGSELSETLKVMELKLYKLIMTPAMIVTWLCGLVLIAMQPDLLSQGWFHVKLTAVLLLSGFHGWCGKQRRRFAADANRHSGRHYRLMNEVPTVLMVIIILMVIIRPF